MIISLPGTGFIARWLLISLLFTLPLHAFVQHFSIQYYTAKDGLPESNVVQTYSDRSGYLWISTTNGLSRFDGKNFKNFGLEHGLNNQLQRAMFEDSRHQFWVATEYAIGRLSGDRFQIYPFTGENEVTYFNAITELDRYGLLALGNEGMYTFDKGRWEKFSPVPGKENAKVINIMSLHDTVYINYRNCLGIIPPKGKPLLTRDRISDDRATHFNQLGVFHDRAYVSTFQQLYAITGPELQPVYEDYLNNKRLSTYFMDSQKNMWISTREDGLVVFAPASDTRHPIKVPFKTNYHISGISEDREGNLWLSTPEGLVKIAIEPFHIINNSEMGGVGEIRHIFPGGKDHLIVSSTTTGLMRFDGNKTLPFDGQYNHDPGDLVDVWSTEDDQTVWAATRFNHLYRISGQRIQDYSHLMPAYNRAYTIDVDFNPSTRKLFICTDSTLYCGDEKKLAVLIPSNRVKPVKMVAAMIITRQGEQLMYTPDSGLQVLTSDNRLLPNGLQLGIPRSMTDMKLVEDANGFIWVVTGGTGLYVLGKNESGQWQVKKHYTTANGLSNNKLHSIAFDSRKRAWVVTSSGIDLVDHPQTGTGRVLGHFNEQQGLYCKNWGFGRLASDRTHTIWFSEPEKLVRFDQPTTPQHERIPTVVVEEVLLNMKKTDWSAFTDSLSGYQQIPTNPSLRHDQNNLQVTYQGIHFGDPRNIYYSYRLLPNDTNWSVPVKFNTVSLLSLKPGSYDFQVRARIGLDSWSNQAGFTFTINSPFWETWWFRALILCLTTLLSVGAYRYRVHQIREKAAIENQLRDLEMVALKAQMNPHFIYNALNSIQSLVADNKRNEAIHYIGTFSRLLRQTLEHSDKNVVTLSRELDTLNLYIQLESLRLNMPLEYNCTISEDIIPEYEKIPPLTLQPFVENALWHGLSQKQGTRKLDIVLDTQPGWIICQIIDNGIGRLAAQKIKAQQPGHPESKGIGLSVKRLAAFNQQQAEDVIDITDLYDEFNQPAGTRIALRISRTPNNPEA